MGDELSTSISDFGDLAELISVQNDLIQKTIDVISSSSGRIAKIEYDVQQIVEIQKGVRQRLSIINISQSSSVLDEVQEYLGTHQLTMLETLERLSTSDLSISRFGDGELRAILSPWFRFSFQQNSAAMSESLRHTLTNKNKNLMIALPLPGRDGFWSGLYPQVWAQLKPMIDDLTMYANAQISRPIAFEHLGHDAVELWRNVWRGKSVSIITGSTSRFDILPELFDSAISVSRIDSLDTDAFSDLPRLLNPSVLGEADIFVISLGPAGTVLAQRLAAMGRRALDVGHLSASYLRVFRGGEHPESLPLTGSA